MSDRRLPAAPTVVPLDQLLSRRDFCRTACLGGAAVLVGLPACGDDPLVVNTSKQDLAAGKTPEDLAQQPPADMSTQPAPDLSSSEPQDLAQNPDLTPPRDMANPNACPPNGVVTSNMQPNAFAMDTATLIVAARAFICRDAGGLFSVSNICTHMGQPVQALNNGLDGLFCPSHSSSYSLNGDVTGGPAPSPLPHFGLCVDGKGNVAITTLTRVASNKRYNF